MSPASNIVDVSVTVPPKISVSVEALETTAEVLGPVIPIVAAANVGPAGQMGADGLPGPSTSVFSPYYASPLQASEPPLQLEPGAIYVQTDDPVLDLPSVTTIWVSSLDGDSQPEWGILPGKLLDGQAVTLTLMDKYTPDAGFAQYNVVAMEVLFNQWCQYTVAWIDGNPTWTLGSVVLTFVYAGAPGEEGPQGPPGPMGQGIDWVGEWIYAAPEANSFYEKDSLVEHNGDVWIATSDAPSYEEPMDSSAYWQLFAPGGPPGPAGADGAPGAQGPQGTPGLSTGAAGGDLGGNYPNPTVVKGRPGFTVAGTINALGVNMQGNSIVQLGSPNNSDDAVPKYYVDQQIQASDAKASVKCVATSPVTLSGQFTIDAVGLNVGNRVLVTAQADAKTNGIYIVASGAWSRALDADAYTEIVNAYVWAEEGAQFGDTAWVCTNNQGGSFSTDNINWVQFASAVAKAGYYSTATHAAGTTIVIPQSQHKLRASRGLIVQIVDETTGVYEIPGIMVAANGDVSIMFVSAVTANSKRITVIG